MIGWGAVLAAGLACFAIKLAGHLAPRGWLERPAVARLAALVTAGLLAALVAVQAASTGQELAADARLPGARRGRGGAVAAAAVHRGRRAGGRDGRGPAGRRMVVNPGHLSSRDADSWLCRASCGAT